MRAWRLRLKCIYRNEMNEKNVRLPCFLTQNFSWIDRNENARIWIAVCYNFSVWLASPHSQTNYFRKCQLKPRNIAIAHIARRVYCLWTWHRSHDLFPLSKLCFIHRNLPLDSRGVESIWNVFGTKALEGKKVRLKRQELLKIWNYAHFHKRFCLIQFTCISCAQTKFVGHECQ